ncbi:MAG: hypothetical protein ACT4NU_11570 [Chromatiales bacterium]
MYKRKDDKGSGKMATVRKLAVAGEPAAGAERPEPLLALDSPARDLNVEDLVLCHRLALDFGIEAALRALESITRGPVE